MRADHAHLRDVRHVSTTFTPKDGPVYRACFTRATELGVVQHHTADLTVHDRAAFRVNEPSRRFLWCVGACGTNLVWLDPPKGEKWDLSDTYQNNPTQARSLMEAFTESRPHFHLWDGSRLVAIDMDLAVALLVEQTESEDA